MCFHISMIIIVGAVAVALELPSNSNEMEKFCMASGAGCNDTNRRCPMPAAMGQMHRSRVHSDALGIKRYLCADETKSKYLQEVSRSCLDCVSANLSRCVTKLQDYIKRNKQPCCALEECSMCVRHAYQQCPCSESAGFLLEMMVLLQLPQQNCPTEPRTRTICAGAAWPVATSSAGASRLVGGGFVALAVIVCLYI